MDNRQSKESSPTRLHTNEEKNGRSRHPLLRPGILLFFFLFLLVLMGIAIALLVKTPPTPGAVLKEKEPLTLQTTTPTAPSPRQYEEEFGGIEELVKQMDFALLETLRTSKIDMQSLELSDVLIKKHNGQDYHFQQLRIPGIKDKNSFLLELQKHLKSRVPQASFSGEGKQILLTVEGVATHAIVLEQQKSASTSQLPPPPLETGPKLVIVIDDIGENMTVLRGLLALDVPLVYAVWPASSHTMDSVRLIRKSGHDMLIHFPMQPKGYPTVQPGKGALFTSMSAKEIRATIHRYTPMVPGAIGANNHMGSRFTEYKPGMQVALEEFKKLGFFFLDSMTTPKSVGRSVAKSLAIPFYKRNVFLDNVKEIPAIVYQLQKAEQIALRKGHAIAIGHPHPVTLAALKQWAPLRNKKISVIPLSKLKAEFIKTP